MTTKLSGILSGIKKAVVDAQQSVSNQHLKEIEQFFTADVAHQSNEAPRFPQGSWTPRTVKINVHREVSVNGKVSIEPLEVQVPLITLVPIQSHQIERVEILTKLDFSSAQLTPEQTQGEQDLSPEMMVSFDGNGPQSAEIKIVITASNPPEGYARLVRAFDKLLNAQLPT